MMWDTLSLPWQACLEEAWTAYRSGSVPIGACVTDVEGRILTRGRNRIHDSCDDDPQCIQRHDFAHAEMNALLALTTERREERYTFVLYTTTEPCPLCLGAWYMSGIRNLRYAARDPWAGSVNLLGTTPYLSRKAVQVTGPERTDLETLIVALHVDFTLRMGSGVTGEFLELWRREVPEGVALGEVLHRDGLLHHLAETGADAAAMTEAVSSASRGRA